MYDTIYKIFPRFFYLKYPDDMIISAVSLLRSYTGNEDIAFTNYNSVQFIDCGDGMEHIFCSWCGRELDIGFWQNAMDKAHDKAFNYLAFRTPCCNLSSSLDEIVYVKPCGFATFVIEVHNPKVVPTHMDLCEMGKVFGNTHFFRMISAHKNTE